MDKMIKVFDSEIRGIDEKEMTVTAFISTNARDRMDDVLDPAGVDLKNYNKNPVVLWAHDYSLPPIGKALWTKRETDKGIISKVKFAPTAFAQEIFQLYKEGYLKAFSVGFMPKEVEDGDGEKQPRRTYKKWEMLEYSAVPVPANPEALALAMQNGILTNEVIIKGMESSDKKEIPNIEQKPKPNKDESKDDFMKRCIPQLISEGKDNDQAAAICNSLWEDKEGKTQTPGLDELIAENKQLKDNIAALEKQINDLKFDIYQRNETIALKQSEITKDGMLNKFEDIFLGVIRKAQGKVD